MIPTRTKTGAAAPHSSVKTLWIAAARRVWLVPAALLCLGAAAPGLAADRAEASKVERGRALYERHCLQCHTESIHARPNRIPLTRGELAGIVDHFRRTANLGWTPEEIDDVVEYLNQTMYRLGR